MNRLRVIEDSIKKEHSNLVKSNNRPRSLQGITEKTEILQDLLKEYKTILSKFEHRLNKKEWNNEVEIYQALKIRFEKSITILENTPVLRKRHTLKSVANTIIFCKRLSGNVKIQDNTPVICKRLCKSFDKNQKENSLVIMPFDIKEATAIVQPYNGSHDGLNTFIDSANLLKDIIEAANLPTAIKFLRTRLTGKARLGLPDNFETIDDLIANVKSRCEVIVTPENILAKLKATRQKGDTDNFLNDVDSLCSQLHATYIVSGVPDDVAKKMATKAGVEALTAGVISQETKIILKAGNFTDVKQAIQKVAENTNSSTSNSQILNFHANRPFDRNQFGNNRGRGNNYNNNNANQRDYRNNNYRRQQLRGRDNFGGNFQRGHGSSHYPHNTQSNRHNRGRGGHNSFRRIYATNVTTNPQIMQHQMIQSQLPQPQPVSNNNSFLGNLAPQANMGEYMH